MKTSDRTINILRVGVTNNYNFTKKEKEELNDLGWAADRLFVNSNSFVTVTGDFPSILTVNPYLESFIEPKGDLSKLKACRVKYIYDAKNPKPVEDSFHWCAANNIPVLITFMRFCSKESLKKYTRAGNGYAFNRSYQRLTKEGRAAAMSDIKVLAKECSLDDRLLNFCDLQEEGCPECLNCARLTYPDLVEKADEIKLFGVSLKSSGNEGECIFHCPDCWAHRLHKGCRGGAYGKITQNSKQKGHSTH